MTPQQFVANWERNNLSERSACQQHFIDLCAMLGQPKPSDVDPDGTWYTFEKGVDTDEGRKGFADVWMKGHFGWEYKRKHRDLNAAYRQLLKYRESLDNPPLLVVCDMDRFEVHTNFTGTAKHRYQFTLKELDRPANLDVLRRVFTEPLSLKPDERTEAITRDAARDFGALADRLRERYGDANRVARFLMKLMFCMFAEDIRLLPKDLFSKLMATGKKTPEKFAGRLEELFRAMAEGGDFALEDILHFNGGLFSDSDVLELEAEEIAQLIKTDERRWEDVEPSIFGTLFERMLDPAKRSQIGAHYTSRDDILTLLEPVMMGPLRREWEEVKADCEKLWEKVRKRAKADKGGPKRRKDSKQKRDLHRRLLDFLERLSHVTVLDPACGSGNFLYVALNLLLDLEKEVVTYAAVRDLPVLPHVRPTQLAGIEINPFAQELAQVVIWIGYLQWMHHNGFNPPSNPVLEPIENIRRQDAILDLSNPEAPLEPEWPEAEFIVGNPPFLGDKKMRNELGDNYVDVLRSKYSNRLPGQSDLCCYWFEKAREQIEQGRVNRVGLLATQNIRGGASQHVVKRILTSGNIFFAITDREWILNGAAVHISMLGFDDGTELTKTIDGISAEQIYANLCSGVDLSEARRLARNQNLGFIGSCKGGSFDVDDEEGVALLKEAGNAHGKPNSDVIKPILNSRELMGRRPFRWIIDNGNSSLEDACLYEAPHSIVVERVKPARDSNRDKWLKENWWRPQRMRSEMRSAIATLSRFLVTPTTSKHRVFAWVSSPVLPDHKLVVFVRQDDHFFGVLHSRIHETWASEIGTQLRERESGLNYNVQTSLEMFPFPEASPEQESAIGDAAAELDRLRSNWLNPPEWTKEEILEFPGSVDGPWARYVVEPSADGIGTVRYPRIVPQDADAAGRLKKRTLTNLYNERPTWLDLAHKRLDEAVFAAYGWPADLSDDDLLAALLELNLSREPA